MALLPDAEHMDIIEEICLSAFETGTPNTAFALIEKIMDHPKLPMHCPYHHYLIPAVLTTVACRKEKKDISRLKKLLKTVRERAGAIPGGFCGQYGCCGAAVGAGIFASVWQGTTPLSKNGWAAGNEMTARCLSAIASVEGPRCCKRVCYLTLSAAVPAAKEFLGISLDPMPALACHHHEQNRECRGEACPFFPSEKN